MLLDIRSGTYLGLDHSARRIVELVDQTGDPELAAKALVERYEVSIDRARTDVRSVLESISSLRATRRGRSRRPTWRGGRGVLRRWWSLPPAHRVAVIEAAAAVAVVEIGLRVIALDRLARWVGAPLATDATAAPPDSDVGADRLDDRLRRLHWAVYWVLTRWSYDATCLRQALALGWFLRRLRPTLRIGMLAEGEVAHAWLDAGDIVLGAEPTTSTFAAWSLPAPGADGKGGRRLG